MAVTVRDAASHASAEPGTQVRRLGRAPLHALWIATLLVLGGLLAFRAAMPELRAAGTPWRQVAAIAGAFLLCMPLLYAALKRSGLTQHPPAWFLVHALAAVAGLVLVALHAGGGRLWSPPGLLLALSAGLVLQGTLARLLLAGRYAELFGSRASSFHRAQPAGAAIDRGRLAALIAEKRALLVRLDPGADEAVFSPTLRHALRHPGLSWRYARLAAQESTLVGARAHAGRLLALWRRVHIGLGVVLVAGLLVHVAVVTLFAGHVAGGREVYWWHLAAWGGP